MNAQANHIMRTLLIEDSVGDAMLIEKSLQQAFPQECYVNKTNSIKSALHALSRYKHDVILLDLSLPDAIGFDGLQSIQNSAPELPIVILTALADETTALSAVRHGAQDYLFKDHTDPKSMRRAMEFAIQRKHYEEVIITRANYDQLTGLVNRSLFDDRFDLLLQKCKRSGEGIGLFYIDLNQFKAVNDTFGHAAGDELLRAVAERLKRVLRSYDTAARFGGDEFALLLEGVTEQVECERIAQKIIDEIKMPYEIDGDTIKVGASVGMTTCRGSSLDSESKKRLLHQADMAMYIAKSSGKDTYVYLGCDQR